MSTDRPSPYIAAMDKLLLRDSQVELLVPRRLLIYAGHGRWIVTDRETPSEDEIRSWTDATAGWSVDGGPSILFISECVPLDERLVAPVSFTSFPPAEDT